MIKFTGLSKPFGNLAIGNSFFRYSSLKKQIYPKPDLFYGKMSFSFNGPKIIYRKIVEEDKLELMKLYIDKLIRRFPYVGVNPRLQNYLKLRLLMSIRKKTEESKFTQENTQKEKQSDEEKLSTDPIQFYSQFYKQFIQFYGWGVILLILFLSGLNAYVFSNALMRNQEPKKARQQFNLSNDSLFENLKQIHIQQAGSSVDTQKNEKKYLIDFCYDDEKKRNSLPYYGNINNLLSLIESREQNKSNKTKIIVDSHEYSYIDSMSDLLSLMMPFFGIVVTFYLFKRVNPQNIMNVLTTKKKFQVEGTKDIKIKFDDVAGMQQAKKQITQFVQFLKFGKKYVEMGAKIPKGALLTGPPGTGKTMLAKACAGEANVAFFYMSGSEFVEMFVGLGASKVRDLFAKARLQAPSIIFIDQIDAIGKKRETSRNEEKDSTLNQLLVEMDGFSSHQTVIVLAATNRKDTLDSALLRPGRFDRMVEVNLPDIKARQQIFMVHLKPLKIDPNQTLENVAKRLSELTPGFSGADISNLCNEAAIIATRKQKTYIEDKDFEEASERITAGYEKKSLVTPKTKKRVAYHQAGHAVAGWFLKGGDPLVKLTIIPRSKGALGYAQYLPKSQYIKTKNDLIDQISILLGGLTSEELFFDDSSSGASDDLQKVYGIARKMVAEFGMSKGLYNVTINEQVFVRKQSQYMSNQMDKQMLDIVNDARKRCKKVLNEKKDIIESLALELLQKETINSQDIKRIMGQRPEFA